MIRTMTVSIFLFLSASAQAVPTIISCQFGESASETFDVFTIDDSALIFSAQDDDHVLKDFRGELSKFEFNTMIEIEGKTRGRDAWRFITAKVDTVNATIFIEQSELETDSSTYHCRDIVVK